jgi:hypothetical protein
MNVVAIIFVYDEEVLVARDARRDEMAGGVSEQHARHRLTIGVQVLRPYGRGLRGGASLTSAGSGAALLTCCCMASDGGTSRC